MKGVLTILLIAGICSCAYLYGSLQGLSDELEALKEITEEHI